MTTQRFLNHDARWWRALPVPHFDEPASMASVFRFLGTGSFAVSSLLTSIRARLYVAFGFVAALTVLCSLIALYAFTTIGDTTTSIVSRNMPAMEESLRLAEGASRLLASVPNLMTAEDEAT